VLNSPSDGLNINLKARATQGIVRSGSKAIGEEDVREENNGDYCQELQRAIRD